MATGTRLYIGGTVDLDVINRAKEKFSRAESHPFFRTPASSKHLFETLEDKDNFTNSVVDSWLLDETNTTRIAPGKIIEKGVHAAIRIKPLSQPVRLQNGIREEQGVCVMIPLQDWSVENGCFLGDFVVRLGDCVCVSGVEPVTFPPSKGGALLIWFFVTIRDPGEESKASKIVPGQPTPAAELH